MIFLLKIYTSQFLWLTQGKSFFIDTYKEAKTVFINNYFTANKLIKIQPTSAE
jgi:maltodextrin utilization protein YvdJ